jgi:hypothetical protein
MTPNLCGGLPHNMRGQYFCCSCDHRASLSAPTENAPGLGSIAVPSRMGVGPITRLIGDPVSGEAPAALTPPSVGPNPRLAVRDSAGFSEKSLIPLLF